MKTLEEYKAELLEAKNAEIKQGGYGEESLLTGGDLDVGDLLDLWVVDHPRPDVVDHENTEQALAAALWILEKDDFVSMASGEGVCRAAKAHKNSILEAIESRCKHCTTAWAAAYKYTENRPSEHYGAGQDQEG